MRIISGQLRGRELGSVPKGVRPTTDRVRESLFSSLGSVDGCAVLDLFAGSGALGIEETTLRNSAAYLQGWMRALKDDKKLFVAAAGKAQRAADWILNEREVTA